MNTRNQLITLFAGVVMTPIVALADGTIAGTVTKQGSTEPLVGASISVMEKTKHDQAEIRYQAITDSQGSYSIPGVRAGKYSITALYPGLRPTGQEGVSVQDGQTVTLNLPLGSY